MEVVAPFKEGVDTAAEKGGETLDLCFQCGLCSTVYPRSPVRDFIPYKLNIEVKDISEII